MPADSAGYSGEGKLLGSSCLDAARNVEADARGTASLRKAKIAVIALVALVIIVPSAMLVAGLSKMLGYTLVMGGSLVATAGLYTIRVSGRIRHVDPVYRRGGIFLLIGGLIAGLVGVPFMQQGSSPPPAHPSNGHR